MKIRFICAFLCALAAVIPGTVAAVIANNAVEAAVISGIEERLMDQAKAWRFTAESYEANIQAREEYARQQARDIITAQTKVVYELVDKVLTDNGGNLSEEQTEDLLNRLSRHTVGRSGYVWILNYDGDYVLSQNRLRDGENIWDASMDGESYPARAMVSIASGLSYSEIGFHEYLWANSGDPEPRSKITSVMHFPRMGWVLGVSAYYDDVISLSFRYETIEDLKDLIASQEVGRSGYIGVVDSNGCYVVSLDRTRDGEDISQGKDVHGNLFVQEAVRRAIAAGQDADIIRYDWQNPGEDSPREKIGGVVYYEPWDWIIWPNAYLDDFTHESSIMRWIILAVGVSGLVFGFAGYELARFVQKRSQPDR